MNQSETSTTENNNLILKPNSSDMMEKLVSLCKRRGFIYQGSEIYGGLAGTWDYGPLGVALKNNIKNSWRKHFVDNREDMYEIDAALLMNPRVWETSGHVGGFADPMVECGNKSCKVKRYRVDHLLPSDVYNEITNRLKNPDIISNLNDSLENEIKSSLEEKGFPESHEGQLKTMTQLKTEEKILEFENKKGIITQVALMENNIKCPSCGQINWGIPKQFNMMFKTQVGAMEDSASTVYFRPETAQGMFVNFKNIVDSFAPKLPFGLAQIGKAFRNEITPKDFIFRVREFEQMEIEYFIKPPQTDSEWQQQFEKLRTEMLDWMNYIGLDMSRVSELVVTGDDLAHYSKATTDFEFDFPFGRKELYGLAYRTDFDLRAHTDASGSKLVIQDENGGSPVIPHCIEPSFGVDRSVLALLTSAYAEDMQGEEVRSFLKFKPHMAPVICAVSPLLKNRPELVEKAREVFSMLKSEFGRVVYDDNGNIGKRYRRQDEIGTPWCIVVDFDTTGTGTKSNPEDLIARTSEAGFRGNTDPALLDTVTVRDRDTGSQQRIAISELTAFIQKNME